jgi:hypothetical protein
MHTTIATMPIGGTPCEEACAQTGITEDAQALNRLECRAYIVALTKHYGPPPTGAELRVKGNPHDFGTYYEVECRYDSTNRAAIDYACKVEAGLARWDDVRMWPPVQYDGSQPLRILREPELWSMDTNPLCFSTVEQLKEAQAEIAARLAKDGPTDAEV